MALKFPVQLNKDIQRIQFPSEVIAIFDSIDGYDPRVRVVAYQLRLETVQYVNTSFLRFFEGVRRLELPDCLYFDCQVIITSYALKSIHLPKCLVLGAFAFARSNVEELVAPAVQKIESDCFAFTSFESLYFPECVWVDSKAFACMTALETLRLPKCVAFDEEAVWQSPILKTLELATGTINYDEGGVSLG